MKSLIRGISVLFAFVLIGAGAPPEEKAEVKPEHAYVGAKKCKTCHKAQFTSWLETKHAKAFETLSAEEQEKPECVKCHITGTTKKGVLLKGIQCEVCHGPGKDYKSLKIMSKKKWKKDPETYKAKAIAAGLIYPTEETCLRCHNDESPNFKDFDFAERKLLVHPELKKKTAK